MIKTRSIHGIVPVVVTPFTSNGEIDVPALEKLTEFLIGQEIGGLWVLGTGSEDMNLTYAKRLQVARVVTEVNDDKIPLVLGAGFFAMEDITNFMHDTRGLKFDAYHVMPYHTLLSLDRLEWFYQTLADKASKPLWMYTSGNWSRQITPVFIERLREYQNVAGIKFSNTNAVLASKVIALANDSFQVITAVAAQLYPSLCMGAKAHTSSLASCLPEAMIEIYKLFQKGNYSKALAKQIKLTDFLKELAKSTKTDNFLQAADEKYILQLRKICGGFTSSYYRDISEVEKSLVSNLLKQYNIFPF